MESKHTPGPWALGRIKEIKPFKMIDPAKGSSCIQIEAPGNGMHIIAECYGPDRYANAAMIEQAPAMLDLIKEFREFVLKHCTGSAEAANLFNKADNLTAAALTPVSGVPAYNIDYLHSLNTRQLSELYTKHTGIQAHQHGYNTILAALYCGKRIKFLTEEELESVKKLPVKRCAKCGGSGYITEERDVNNDGDYQPYTDPCPCCNKN